MVSNISGSKPRPRKLIKAKKCQTKNNDNDSLNCPPKDDDEMDASEKELSSRVHVTQLISDMRTDVNYNHISVRRTARIKPSVEDNNLNNTMYTASTLPRDPFRANALNDKPSTSCQSEPVCRAVNRSGPGVSSLPGKGRVNLAVVRQLMEKARNPGKRYSTTHTSSSSSWPSLPPSSTLPRCQIVSGDFPTTPATSTSLATDDTPVTEKSTVSSHPLNISQVNGFTCTTTDKSEFRKNDDCSLKPLSPATTIPSKTPLSSPIIPAKTSLSPATTIPSKTPLSSPIIPAKTSLSSATTIPSKTPLSSPIIPAKTSLSLPTIPTKTQLSSETNPIKTALSSETNPIKTALSSETKSAKMISLNQNKTPSSSWTSAFTPITNGSCFSSSSLCRGSTKGLPQPSSTRGSIEVRRSSRRSDQANCSVNQNLQEKLRLAMLEKSNLGESISRFDHSNPKDYGDSLGAKVIDDLSICETPRVGLPSASPSSPLVSAGSAGSGTAVSPIAPPSLQTLHRRLCANDLPDVKQSTDNLGENLHMSSVRRSTRVRTTVNKFTQAIKAVKSKAIAKTIRKVVSQKNDKDSKKQSKKELLILQSIITEDDNIKITKPGKKKDKVVRKKKYTKKNRAPDSISEDDDDSTIVMVTADDSAKQPTPVVEVNKAKPTESTRDSSGPGSSKRPRLTPQHDRSDPNSVSAPIPSSPEVTSCAEPRGLATIYEDCQRRFSRCDHLPTGRTINAFSMDYRYPSKAKLLNRTRMVKKSKLTFTKQHQKISTKEHEILNEKLTKLLSS